MHVYRITPARFTSLDGEGARLYGGRWNSEGRRVVYCAQSLALAALETLVHVSTATAPLDLVALTVEITDTLVRVAANVSVDELPSGWNVYPHAPVCRAIGNAWADAASSAILRVPSVAVPEESNFLINAAHPDTSHVRVTSQRPFSFDARLLR